MPPRTSHYRCVRQSLCRDLFTVNSRDDRVVLASILLTPLLVDATDVAPPSPPAHCHHCRLPFRLRRDPGDLRLRDGCVVVANLSVGRLLDAATDVANPRP